jgi:hypothetical protein
MPWILEVLEEVKTCSLAHDMHNESQVLIVS